MSLQQFCLRFGFTSDIRKLKLLEIASAVHQIEKIIYH